MATLMVKFKSDASLERFRAAYTANQNLESPATDEQLCQYLEVQASAITYDVEVRQNGGSDEDWVPI